MGGLGSARRGFLEVGLACTLRHVEMGPGHHVLFLGCCRKGPLVSLPRWVHSTSPDPEPALLCSSWLSLGTSGQQHRG